MWTATTAKCNLLAVNFPPNKSTEKTRVYPARIHARFSRKTNMREVIVVSKRKLLVQLMNFPFKILSKAGCNILKQEWAIHEKLHESDFRWQLCTDKKVSECSRSGACGLPMDVMLFQLASSRIRGETKSRSKV